MNNQTPTFEQILEGLKQLVNVQNIQFNKDEKLLDIYLLAAEPISYMDARQVENTIVEVVAGIEKALIHFIYTPDKIQDAEWFNMYWNIYVREKITAFSPATGKWLSHCKVKMVSAETLEIHIPSKTIYDHILNKKCDKFIENQFNAAFDVRCEVVLNLLEETGGNYDEHRQVREAEVVEFVKSNCVPGAPGGGTEASKPQYSSGASSKGNGGGYKRTKAKSDDPSVVYKRLVKQPLIKINEIMEEESIVCIEGKVFFMETRELKGGKTLVSFALTDYSGSMTTKIFLDPKDLEIIDLIKKGKRYKVEGRVRYDTFEREMVIMAMAINHAPDEKERQDLSEEKRVELHAHTNMSSMDGLTAPAKIVEQAAKWGHKAVAITDHGVVQGFPEAMGVAKKLGIKVIYGVEGYVVNDQAEIVLSEENRDLAGTYVVFDIETTGLSFANDKITEIGAVKIENGNIVDQFSALVDPQMPLPPKIVELTGITDDMLRGQPTIDEVLPKFMAFIGDASVVAHNASFDTSFIKENCNRQKLVFNAPVLDTLSLSRLLLKNLKRHRLNTIAKHLKIELLNHHRAVDDAVATAKIFLRFMEMLKEQDVYTFKDINRLALEDADVSRLDTYHIIILVQNQTGLKNLYEMISHSHVQTFFKRPRIPKSLLAEKREGLILGTACEAGELYRAIMNNQSDAMIESLVQYYDYLEIQPVGNNQFMIEKGLVKDEDELRSINQRIVDLGQRFNKPVAATGDIHFLNPRDEVYRRILMTGQGYSDADNQPPLYFKTTDEMLNEFKYLGSAKAKEVVIDVPNQIADMVEEILPIPNGTFPPVIEGSDDELRDMCVAKAKKIYGESLPEVVQKRLDRELNSIISNGYSVMYIISQKLVTKSLEDGFLVGSRGSVGSSFAATMSDITEVNPLPPHYICVDPECKYSEFLEKTDLGSGVDLPDKDCPSCGKPLKKDGHAIPFETFLGFEGDKEPDIDLNFAGVYQANSHKYCEVLFGEGKTFKAGTIGTIAEKTAFGYVKKYFEEKEQTVSNKEVLRLSEGCTGVKRTTGQHPGGIMVVPDYKDVHDFCPIQRPANDQTSDVLTTHFDYHSISGRILKLDILGHDVPTIIRHLEEITDTDVQNVPLDDPDTVSIFTTIDKLNIVDKTYPLKIGSLGIPEFGTKFVRQMLVDTQPSTFSDLVRISGLSHGTDVWLNNAQDLVRDNVCQIKDVISTRDDIMNYLIFMDLPPKEAFTIMERVRKGKGLTDENLALMREKNVPEWYIKSCNTIKYMFPKAHAVAYVMMSFRIAYYKVHHPLAFYATFFSTKVDDFDADLMTQGKSAILAKMKELDNPELKLTQKEKDLYTMLEVVREYFARGLELMKVDLYKSDSDKFKVVDGKLLPPLRALQGVGENAARSIAVVREDQEFLSKEDLRKRAKVTKTVIETLTEHGCLKGLPDDNQLSLFGDGLFTGTA